MTIQFGANFSINGVPETGLSPTISIRRTDSGALVVTDAALYEVGDGAYRYNFSNDTALQYSAVIDGAVDTLDYRYMAAWSERAKTEAEVVQILEDTAAMPTVSGIVTGILAGVIEGTLTVKGVQRVLLSVLAAESDGAKTATQHFRDTLDTKNRVTATMDVDGNRTNITLDVSD